MNRLVPYNPPEWVKNSGISAHLLPEFKVPLGRFPTPIQEINIPGLEELGLISHIKRDDLSSFELSGNKARKLEFLLAEMIQKNHDCIIAIGNVQSNFCRATTVAARQLGFESHLILRLPEGKESSDLSDDAEIGIVGNLLFDRMVGSQIYKVSSSTYREVGSDNLCHMLAEQLKKNGKRNPYIIPFGGANIVGAFGHFECFQEIIEQSSGALASSSSTVPSSIHNHYDHIVFASCSGMAVDMAIGLRLSGVSGTQLHAIGVTESPDYFYKRIEEAATQMGLNLSELPPVTSWCNIYAGEGAGYGVSTEEELKYIIEFSEKTGILLDPVYTGKAVYHFVNIVVKQKPLAFQKGQTVLFIHTGGVFGLYDKERELVPLLALRNNVHNWKL